MSFSPLEVLRNVLDPSCGLTTPERIVLLALVRHADADGNCYPSQRRIAACTRLGIRAVRNALAALEANGWTERKRARVAEGVVGTIYTVTQAAPDAAGTTCRRHDMPLPPAPGAASPPAPGAAKLPIRELPIELVGADASSAKQKRNAKRPKRSSGNEQPAVHGYTETVNAYFAAFEQARGCRPPFGSREGKAVRELIDALGGAEPAQGAIRAAYADAWWSQTKRGTILDLARDPARFVAPVVPPKSAPTPDAAALAAEHQRRQLELDAKIDAELGVSPDAETDAPTARRALGGFLASVGAA